ncbi:MAG: DotU family type IV/VI secretion system protein [Planctomycetota bacterium]
MRPDIAELVDPVFHAVGCLREALRAHEIAASDPGPSIKAGRSELKERLTRIQSEELASGRGSSGDYLGLRYPLVCWIDEVMTEDPLANIAWNENKLEGELFGTNDRAWMFWRQSELAETLARSDDLAVFYLCVSLGFSGQHRGNPDQLNAWMHRIRIGIGMVPELKLPFAHDLAPPSDVPPLRGTGVLRRASHIGWTAAVVLLPVISYLAVSRWAE